MAGQIPLVAVVYVSCAQHVSVYIVMDDISRAVHGINELIQIITGMGSSRMI